MTTTRRNIMLGTAGHVDHGKTALVKLLTGCETDTMAEEKQRGLTIDLGFAPCQLSDKRVVGVVDVPGHVDFIRNMVAGAHGIDVVIFVVAADDGIMPQTHEHLHILTLMGLRHGLVALTKVDLVDAARREFVIQDLRRLLAKTFLADAPICPMSNLTGEGFDGFFDSLNDVVAACEDRPCSGWFRLWVEDVFTIRGSGTVITGIPTSGRVRTGDHLHLLPAGATGRVRRMQVYGDEATEGRAGECVALNVPELDHQAVRRGMLLTEAELPAPVTMAEAELRILDALPGKIEDYLEVQLHVGTASGMAHVAMLEATEMVAGQRQMVQLRLAEPLPLAPGERFVVRANVADAGRDGLTTIGGGRILGTSNARLRRKKQWTIDALTARRDALDDPLRWCELMVRESEVPSTAGGLQQKCLLHARDIADLVELLSEDGRLSKTSSGAWLHRDTVDQTAAAVLAAIQAFHAANPQRAGLGHDALLAAVKAGGELLDLAIAALVAKGQAVRTGELVAVAGWKPQVTDRDQQLGEQIEAQLRTSGWTPPSPEELAMNFGETLPRISTILRLLAERGRVVKLEARVWMHRDAVEAGTEAALKLFRRAPAFTTMDFRDALGVSRKFAVPLLDHLDRLRFTVRTANNRTPGAEARKLMTHTPR
jgi:selenocysteine-specific elongation factor